MVLSLFCGSSRRPVSLVAFAVGGKSWEILQFFLIFFCQSGCDYFFRNTATFQQLFWGFAFHAFLSISPLQMPAAPGLKGESRLDLKGKQQTSKQMTKKQTNNQTALWSDLDALGDIRPCHLSYVSKPVSAAGAEWEQKRGLR